MNDLAQKHYTLNVNDSTSTFLNGFYTIDTNIVIGTFDGILTQNTNGQFAHKKFFRGAIEYVRDIDHTDSSIYICVADGRIRSKNSEIFSEVGNLFNRRVFLVHASCLTISDKYIYLGNWDNKVIKVSLDHKRIIEQFKVSIQPISKLRINDIIITDNSIFISTQAGVFEKQPNKIFKIKTPPSMNENVLKIEKLDSIKSFIIYSSSGMHIKSAKSGIRKLNSKISRLSEFSHLFSVHSSDSTLIIKSPFNTYSFDKETSTPNSTLINSNKIWLHVNNEIYSLDLTRINDFEYINATTVKFLNSIYSNSYPN